jgi:deoxyribose-phosphate aldolase
MSATLPPWLAPYAGHRGLGALIDHTLLKPEATESDIVTLADEAVRLQLGTICVNGQWVRRAARCLEGSNVRVAAVIGFPLGASGAVTKAAETRLAVMDGAAELDVVIALGLARAGRWDLVRDELAVVISAARRRPVKAILETAALTPEEIARACEAALQAGVAMVKTSTGFHPKGGATEESVRLLRKTVGTRAGVKASGGIRAPEDAIRMLLAGANRIGTSAAAAWTGAVGSEAPSFAELLGAQQ